MRWMGGIICTPVHWMAQYPAEGVHSHSIKHIASSLDIWENKKQMILSLSWIAICNIKSLISPLHRLPQKWNKAFKLLYETMVVEYQNSLFLVSLSMYTKSKVSRAILRPAVDPILPAWNDKGKQRCQTHVCTRVLSRMARFCMITPFQIL